MFVAVRDIEKDLKTFRRLRLRWRETGLDPWLSRSEEPKYVRIRARLLPIFVKYARKYGADTQPFLEWRSLPDQDTQEKLDAPINSVEERIEVRIWNQWRPTIPSPREVLLSDHRAAREDFVREFAEIEDRFQSLLGSTEPATLREWFYSTGYLTSRASDALHDASVLLDPSFWHVRPDKIQFIDSTFPDQVVSHGYMHPFGYWFGFLAEVIGRVPTSGLFPLPESRENLRVLLRGAVGSDLEKVFAPTLGGDPYRFSALSVLACRVFSSWCATGRITSSPIAFTIEDHTFSVRCADAVCVLGNTKLFWLFKALNNHCGNYVAFPKLAEAIDNHATDSIHHLKTRLKKKLVEAGMPQLADAIQTTTGHYRLFLD